jgi:hypothetical protein
MDSRVGGLYNRGQIVNDVSVWCKIYITEVLCATCISQNRGHKKLIALSHDELSIYQRFFSVFYTYLLSHNCWVQNVYDRSVECEMYVTKHTG